MTCLKGVQPAHFDNDSEEECNHQSQCIKNGLQVLKRHHSTSDSFATFVTFTLKWHLLIEKL